MRWAVAEGLVAAASPEAVADLARAAQDPDEGVRSAAIRALRRIGGPVAAQAIQAATCDPHPVVRARAEEAAAGRPPAREWDWECPFPPTEGKRSYMMDVDPSDVVDIPDLTASSAQRSAQNPSG